MMKRVFRSFWSAEKQVASEYETWSKQQLIDKIKELEGQSGNKVELVTKSAKENSPVDTPDKPQKKKKKFDFSQYNTRFIALRFAYIGWNYNGLAYQYEPTPLPTIEEQILVALEKAKLISAVDLNCCQFSRCGRTDKGVSAMNQVISLNVRSNLSPEDQTLKAMDHKELPYVTILNSLLPADIRITAVCLRPPPQFDARFSCKYRHYRYLIHKENLDLELLQQAAAKYIGVHDFRNFCKLDGSKQITNYTREVFDAKIIDHDDEFYIFDLKGTAFLWHQVRCMVAILLVVGQKLEDISIIEKLFDVDQYPCRPNYEMANDIPLILYDCVFPEMEWIQPIELPNFSKATREYSKLKGEVMDYQLKSRVSSIMKEVVVTHEDKITNAGGYVNLGDGKGRHFRNYIPIMDRDVAEPVEVVNERFRQKKLAKGN